MERKRATKVYRPYYGEVWHFDGEVFPAKVAAALPEGASKDQLLEMWQGHDFFNRRVALYGFIHLMPAEPIAQQVVSQALQEYLLGNDALYWIKARQAHPLALVVAESLFMRRTLHDGQRSVALETLSHLGYDFRPHEPLLWDWARQRPTFEDITPIVAIAILLKMQRPRAKRLLSRSLRTADQHLLSVGLRVLSDHAPLSLIADELMRFAMRLSPRTHKLFVCFRTLELLLTVPLSERWLQQLCRQLEAWRVADPSAHFTESLRYFQDGYLTRRGYPLGGGRLVSSNSPDPANVPIMEACVRRLLGQNGDTQP
jgi:hypothetical protein